jgi:hypothetical protein
MYSETCEIRTPLGRPKRVPHSEMSSFQGAICTEDSYLGPDEVSLIFTGCPYFTGLLFTGFTVLAAMLKILLSQTQPPICICSEAHSSFVRPDDFNPLCLMLRVATLPLQMCNHLNLYTYSSRCVCVCISLSAHDLWPYCFRYLDQISSIASLQYKLTP